MRTRQESSCIGATNASATTIIEYLVDGMGRRLGKKVNGTVTKKWLWRSQLQPVAQLDGSNQVVARYVYADGVNVPDQIITATATYRLIKDHLGSVRLVVDEATGTVVQRIDYDSWGRVLTDTNPGFQPFGFAGGLYDPDTGLVRFGARDYDPEIGRWTAKDPIRFSDSGNLYEYAISDPVNFVDPRGEYAGLLIAGGLARAAGAAALVTAGVAVGGGYLIDNPPKLPPFPIPTPSPGPIEPLPDLSAVFAAAAAVCAASQVPTPEQKEDCNRRNTECFESHSPISPSRCSHCWEKCRAEGEWPDVDWNGNSCRYR